MQIVKERIKARLDYQWRCLRSEAERINQQLMAGQTPDAPVVMQVPLPPKIFPEGRMFGGEEWLYPSADLLTYLAYEGDRPEDMPPHLPFRFQGNLLVILEADDHRLHVQIPLNPVPWVQPRAMWDKELEPLAKMAGRRPRKAKQEWLAQFRQPHPDIGRRSWIVQASDETRAPELLTALVIAAEQDGFSVSEDDRQRAWTWICGVMRDGFRVWNIDPRTCAQLIKDFVGQVYEGLFERFDLPATDWSLRDYVQVTARRLAQNAAEKERLQHGLDLTPDSVVDPISGEVKDRVYSVAQAAHLLRIPVRTVYQWRRDAGIRTQTQGGYAGFSGAELEAMRTRLEEKTARERIWQEGRSRGMSDAAIKKMLSRGRKAQKPWGEMLASMKRRNTRARAVASPVDEHAVADLQMLLGSRLAEATSEDERLAILDKLQQLERLSRS